VQGINDPKREDLYNEIITDLLYITDHLHILMLDSNSSRLYHIYRNRMKQAALQPDLKSIMQRLESVELDFSVNALVPNEDTQLAHARELYQTQKELFNVTWTNTAWTNVDEEAANDILHSAALSQTDIALFVSAVTMSLFECFDLSKMMWLIKAYSSPSAKISERAIVGFFLLLHRYADRIKYYPTIKNSLLLLRDDFNFKYDMTICYGNYINCLETEKITRIMNDEIMPGIIRDMNSIHKPIDNENSEDEDDGPKMIFPDIENKDIQDKLERMTRLSVEGGDLYMSTFQNLKSFSFFYDIENWFKSFDMHQPIVISNLKDDNSMTPLIRNIINKLVFLCDSDRYSLIHILPKMAGPQFEMMRDQLQQAEDALDEERSKDSDANSEEMRGRRNENENYFHDLYRFFKLYQRKNEFVDIFQTDIFGYPSDAINKQLCDVNTLTFVAEFLLGKKSWLEANEVYKSLLDLDTKNERGGNLHQHLGYTYYKMADYEDALREYREAEIFLPDDDWLKTQIAHCHRLLGETDEALSYYRMIEPKNEENVRVLYAIGECLADGKNYEEAMQYFFKVNLLQPENVKAMRAIGWYSFICNKLDQAKDYMERVIDRKPIASDYLNMGHIYWLKGDLRRTVEYYTKALALCASLYEFTNMFNADVHYLTEKGVDENIIPLVLDMVEI
jgi:tetratricopeptide (TPR) repeat protein